MDNVVSSFPLLYLPNKDILRVLRNMEILDQIAFSLCSEKSKSLTKSLSIKVENIYTTVNESINLEASFDNSSVKLTFFAEEDVNLARGNEQQQMKLPIPRFVEIIFKVDYEYQLTRSFEHPRYSVRDWIDHFLDIFNHSKIDEFCFKPGHEIYDVDTIQKTFHGLEVKTLRMAHEHPNQSIYHVPKIFLPTKKLCLAVRLYQDPELMHKFLMQNFDTLSTGVIFRVVLNDLLIMNSLQVRVFGSILTEKELNKFLKLWIDESNHRLRRLFIHYFTTNDKRSLDEKHFLNGIKYQVVSNENVRTLEDEYSDTRTREINSGFDIWRKDGTVATIQTSNLFNGYAFEMFVWN